jgi:hypothetical protein
VKTDRSPHFRLIDSGIHAISIRLDRLVEPLQLVQPPISFRAGGLNLRPSTAEAKRPPRVKH